METQWLGFVDYEVFKTVNDLNPNFIRTLYRSPNFSHEQDNLYVLCSLPKYSKVWK